MDVESSGAAWGPFGLKVCPDFVPASAPAVVQIGADITTREWIVTGFGERRRYRQDRHTPEEAAQIFRAECAPSFEEADEFEPLKPHGADALLEAGFGAW